MKKRILKNLGAGASNKAVALGFVAMIGANGTFAANSSYMMSSSNGISAVAAAAQPEVTTDDVLAKARIENAITDARTAWDNASKAIAGTYYTTTPGSNLSVYEAFNNGILTNYAKAIDDAEAEFKKTEDYDMEEQEDNLIGMLPVTADITSLTTKAAAAKTFFGGLKFEEYTNDVKNSQGKVTRLNDIEAVKRWASKNAKLAAWASSSLDGEIKEYIEDVRKQIVDLYVAGNGSLSSADQAAMTAKADFIGHCVYTFEVKDADGNITTPEAWQFDNNNTLLDRFKQRAADEQAALTQYNNVKKKIDQAYADIQKLEYDQTTSNAYTTQKGNLDNAKAALERVKSTISAEDKDFETYTSQQSAWVASINAANTTYTNAWTAINSQAKTYLEAKLGVVQNSWTESSYAVSAKYENEPDVQKEYQDKFAAIQVELTKIGNDITANNNNLTLVGQNKTIFDAIDEQSDKITKLAGEASTAQVQAILDSNTAEQKKFNTAWNKLNEEYLEHIQKMQYYEELAQLKDYREDAIVNAVTYARIQLFGYLEKINTLKAKADKKIADANNAKPIPSYYYYDVTNSTDDEANEILQITNGMQAIRLTASTAVNNIAKTYLDASVFTTKNADITYYSNRYNSSDYSWVNGKLNDLRNKYLVDNSSSAGTDLNKYTPFALKEKYYGESTLADYVVEIENKVKPFDTELGDIIEEGRAQSLVRFGYNYNEYGTKDETALSLNELLAYWTKAWGNKDDKSEGALQTINGNITKFQNDLNTKCDAGQVLANKESLLAQINDLYNDVYVYAEPEAYTANEAALAELNKLFGEVETQIADTRAVINTYVEAVKTQFLSQVSSVEVQLNNLKAEADELHNNRKLASDYSVKGSTQSLKYTLTTIATNAAKAQEDATKVDGDVNGDRIVNSTDLSIVWNVFSGKITDETQKAAADVNGDKKVTITDVQYVLNRISEK